LNGSVTLIPARDRQTDGPNCYSNIALCMERSLEHAKNTPVVRHTIQTYELCYALHEVV